MTNALSADQRTRLEQLVGRARTTLEADLADVAAGRFGVDADGTLADEDDLRLDPTALAARRELVDVIAHLRSEGHDAPAAAARLLREAVFTHLNRLIAIRIAEALALLPPSLANGRKSQGFRDLLELAPLLAGDDTGGYWTYLQLCADELASDIPTLFDPRNPLLAISPSPGAVDDLVDRLADPTVESLWTAPDCLGWVYQLFNRKEERDAMREASSSPRNSRELAVRNQFFTPRYVVDFLVQNTLGRRLVESDPSTPLVKELPLLVDPPERSSEAIDLHEVTVLDPAVGSGHFLLGAYDVLERAWELAGVHPAESAPKIVQSLWGVDIDVRAAQVAAAAVILRARRNCRNAPLPRPNILTARSTPHGPDGLPAVARLTTRQRDALSAVVQVMARAPELGSLLKVEEELDAEIRHGGFGRAPGPGEQGVLHLPDDVFADEEAAILASLRSLADNTTSTAPERLFAAEAHDALRFIEAMRRKYDVVLMNPPFGEPIAETKPYLKAAYPWSPSRMDMLAAFVARGLELCKPEGYVGAITNRSGLFITTFEDWRKQTLLSNRLTAMADLGYRVMTQAKVEAAAYVVGRGKPDPNHTAVFIRLLKEPDKAKALADVANRLRGHEYDARAYRLPLLELNDVPGAPIAYAMSKSVRRLFSDLPSVGEGANEIRVGLQTGNDARFVRTFWEVNPHRIARSLEETRNNRRWAPFAKGGDYGQYWSDIHLVVDYENEGERLSRFRGAVIRNPQSYFLPGLTWPRRTNSALSVRVLPSGCIFADMGPAAISQTSLPLLAWLNSRYVRLLIDATAESADENKTDVSRSYYVGTIKSLPDPTKLSPTARHELEVLARQAAQLAAERDEFDETARRFVAPAVLHVGGLLLRDRAHQVFLREMKRAISIIEAHDDIDLLLRRLIDPDGSAEQALYDADGPLVTDLPAADDADPTLLAKPLRDSIAEATTRHGIARWIGLQHHAADRRLELAAVAENCAPKALIKAAPADILPPEEPKRTADDFLSYLFGVAMGRWDLRIGREPDTAPARPDLFEPVPLCAPGLLVGDDGFPIDRAPEGYPVELPPGRILLDQPGHPWDVEARLNKVAQVLTDHADDLMSDIAATHARTVRDHIRRQFFRDHLVRYSKSKRKAPIYWPLYVPSAAWGVWVYAPMLSRETLFAVSRAARDRLDGAEAEIRRLQRERHAGGAGRTAREVANALETEEKLAEELRRFREETERIAALGWEPDLDDGIILCAAPLAGLFPAWRDAAAARRDIKAGKYPWSTVSRWADQL